MTDHDLSREDAERALAEVSERRRQVAGIAAPVPAWYPPVMGVLTGVWLGLVESHSSAGTLGGLAIMALHGLLIWWTRQHQPVRPHVSLYGIRGWLAIAGAMAVFFALAMTALSLIHAARVPQPALVYGVVAGILCTALTAGLRLWLVRIFVRRAAEVRP